MPRPYCWRQLRFSQHLHFRHMRKTRHGRPSPASLASGVYNINTNWTPATVPTGTALFGASNSTTLKFLPPGATVGRRTFNTGASAYTFIASVPLLFNGAGIIINGGNATINNTSILSFRYQHGRQRHHQQPRHLRFNEPARPPAPLSPTTCDLNFNNTSTAGTASITNNAAPGFRHAARPAAPPSPTTIGYLNFKDTSTAGSATITNDNSLTFTDTARPAAPASPTTTSVFGRQHTAGSATITNNTIFISAATARAATPPSPTHGCQPWISRGAPARRATISSPPARSRVPAHSYWGPTN